MKLKKNVQNCLSNTESLGGPSQMQNNWLHPHNLTAPAGHYLTTKALLMSQ